MITKLIVSITEEETIKVILDNVTVVKIIEESKQISTDMQILVYKVYDNNNNVIMQIDGRMKVIIYENEGD